jgi:hypothetical protein
MVEQPTPSRCNVNGICSKIIFIRLPKTHTCIHKNHTYICKQLFSTTFHNNNHWILFKIHVPLIGLHCIIYDSKAPMIKRLLYDIVQLQIDININVKYQSYKYANVM